MGNTLGSKLKEEEELNMKPSSTPSKRIHRILDLDPRSPTIGVDRTPIAVNVTPRTMVNEADICTTPQVDPIRKLDLDPRSPSTDIMRTPLQLDSQALENVTDPRSPGIPRTPIVAEFNDSSSQVLRCRTSKLLHESNSDSSPNIDAIPAILDQEVEVMNRSLSEPDLRDEVKLLRNSNRSTGNAFRESTPKKKYERKGALQGLSHDDLACVTFEAKEKPSQRSPLALRTNVDVNSPRNIVQRKQVNKLNHSIKANQSSRKNLAKNRYQALDLTDKENVH